MHRGVRGARRWWGLRTRAGEVLGLDVLAMCHPAPFLVVIGNAARAERLQNWTTPRAGGGSSRSCGLRWMRPALPRRQRRALLRALIEAKFAGRVEEMGTRVLAEAVEAERPGS
jgi:hypothetical protein